MPKPAQKPGAIGYGVWESEMRRVIIGHNQTITRQVCLPVLGNIKVRAGEHVDFGDLIAETTLPARFEMIDIPNHFNVSPEEADTMIKRLVGDVIAKGDVLAQKDGFITQLFRSPGDGKLVSLREGRITLALGQEKMQVFAPMPGMVAELIDGRGAVITLTGSVVESSWGNGKSAQGELIFWGELEKKGLGIASALVKDKIIVFKKAATAGQLRRVLRLKPAGLILPSINPEQLKSTRESDVAVLSLLGFGELRMDVASLELIESMSGQTVYIVAQENTVGPKENPLLILPKEKKADLGLYKEEIKLAPGLRVRLRGEPYTGMVGIVKGLPSEEMVFASGLQSPSVVVICEGDQMINASIHNIDLIQS
ncbi:MAG: hypothetical protein GX884_00545 [Chloroflexi bacterium]|nr:hypothetical protein [Chloroflexota bacterium]